MSQHYKAEVEFVNEGDVYGAITVYVEAGSDQEADEIASRAAEDHYYADDRIPDRSLRIALDEINLIDIPDGVTIHSANAVAVP